LRSRNDRLILKVWARMWEKGSKGPKIEEKKEGGKQASARRAKQSCRGGGDAPSPLGGSGELCRRIFEGGEGVLHGDSFQMLPIWGKTEIGRKNFSLKGKIWVGGNPSGVLLGK